MPIDSNHARTNEGGFSVIELAVVCLIVMILIAVTIFSVSSSRAGGQMMAARAAAQAYANAADDFARDHQGRYPGALGSDDWPKVQGSFENGPVASVLASGAGRKYLRRVPEAVQSDQLEVAAVGTMAQDGAIMTYRPAAQGRGYIIQLQVPGREPCQIYGGSATGTIRNCAPR